MSASYTPIPQQLPDAGEFTLDLFTPAGQTAAATKQARLLITPSPDSGEPEVIFEIRVKGTDGEWFHEFSTPMNPRHVAGLKQLSSLVTLHFPDYPTWNE